MRPTDPIKIKAQVLCGAEVAMGPGKADLLEAIDREGSISGAGRAMGMSYRRAWQLADAMNRCWSGPLVEATAGGGRRSGARLTMLGRAVLAHYRSLEARLAEVALRHGTELAGDLLDAPRDVQRPAP